MPPWTGGEPLRTFLVNQPFDVEAGIVAPWEPWNAAGFGAAFRLPPQRARSRAYLMYALVAWSQRVAA
jgi:antirestriction protein ArdC